MDQKRTEYEAALTNYFAEMIAHPPHPSITDRLTQKRLNESMTLQRWLTAFLAQNGIISFSKMLATQEKNLLGGEPEKDALTIAAQCYGIPLNPDSPYAARIAVKHGVSLEQMGFSEEEIQKLYTDPELIQWVNEHLGHNLRELDGWEVLAATNIGIKAVKTDELITNLEDWLAKAGAMSPGEWHHFRQGSKWEQGAYVAHGKQDVHWGRSFLLDAVQNAFKSHYLAARPQSPSQLLRDLSEFPPITEKRDTLGVYDPTTGNRIHRYFSDSLTPEPYQYIHIPTHVPFLDRFLIKPLEEKASSQG